MGNHLTHGPRTRALQRRRVDASPPSSEKPRCTSPCADGNDQNGNGKPGVEGRPQHSLCPGGIARRPAARQGSSRAPRRRAQLTASRCLSRAFTRGRKTGSHGHPQGRDGGFAPRLPLGCWADGRTEVVPAYGGRPLGNEHEKPRGGRRAVGGARVRGLPEGRDSTGMGSACAAARGRAWGEQGGGPSRTCQRAHALAHTHALTHPLRAAASQEGTRLDCGGLEGAAVSQPFTRHREERALRRLQRPQDVWSRADAQDVAFGVQQSRLGPHRPAVAPARWPPQW